MIKIPQNGRFSQPNNSDLFGNLWYTKNINLDEEGYIKLSPRAVSLQNETTDSALGLPLSFGREANGVYKVATTDEAFEVALTNNLVSVGADDGTGAPTTISNDGYGTYFNNRWYVTDSDELYYRDAATGNWTDTNISATLTAGKVHFLEVFKNKNNLAVSNGNTVILLDTAHATQVTLTLPADFEVNALAYNNNKLGVSTLLSDTVDGQNQEAYFFVWDGETAEADAGYAVGTDMIISVAPYKSSWVLLTRSGNLMYFNGGGFDTLASFPYYFKDLYWGDTTNIEALGDILQVDGDVIYINFSSQFNYYGKNDEKVLQNCPGGVWCYDPKIGLYHRYSPSISGVSMISVAPSSNVNTTTDIITKSSGTLPATGNPIKYISDGSEPIGGVLNGNVYYIIKHTDSTFSLAETKAQAEAGVKVDITSQKEGVFMALDLKDFGQSYMAASGGITVPLYTDHVLGGLLFGNQLTKPAANSFDNHINFICTGFDNIGYFVTPKISSTGIKDTNQKAYIKFKPLKDNDSITVKVKERDVVGLPISTPQYAAYMTWSSSDTLVTSNGLVDFSWAADYLDASDSNELELEVISGNGAGQMAQIESIEESGGVYTIVLKEELTGITAGYLCNVIIDNWKKISEITSANVDGYQELPVGLISKAIKYKVILKGVDTTVEELSHVSQNNKNAV